MSTHEAIYISAERRTELEGELKERKEITRQDILAKLQYAKSLGDLSENAEYHDARERQGKNESRIQQIEHILKNAVLVEKKTDGTIGLGSEVTIKKEGATDAKTYTIVGPAEADMMSGRLSSESPLGEAVMGHTEGDVVEFETPRGITNYTIVSVS